MKKGFKNIESTVQEIWAMGNLQEAKDKLISTIGDLHKATKTKKYNLIESVKNASSKRRIDQIATSIMFQDDKKTSSFQNL
mgnify:FL=1|tara:strand:+ start:291 stop:533 length:243 start_codon:yes stop_codon:yes gene_type:complete